MFTFVLPREKIKLTRVMEFIFIFFFISSCSQSRQNECARHTEP